MKRSICAALALIILSTGLVTGQDECPKFQIGVYLFNSYGQSFGDNVLDSLNRRTNSNRSEQEWIDYIDANIIQTLNSYNYEDLEFFSPKAEPGREMDLMFSWMIKLSSFDKDLIKSSYPTDWIDSITGWEVTDWSDPVYSQGIMFNMNAGLTVVSPCYPPGYYQAVLAVEFARSEDIIQCIKNLVDAFYPMDRMIWYWESKHLAPARKPKMEISYQRDYISLLDPEWRKMEISVKVKNCRGQYVYNESHSQPVYFEKETDRLRTRSSNKCVNGPDYGIFRTILTNKEYEAICEYSVKNGFTPSVESVKFRTCGIGASSMIEEEGEIIVRGLELLVEPWRTTIHNGEQTTISIDLHEIDPYGVIYPAIDQEVEIKVTGLVDGSISPKGKVTVGDMGIAWIDYKAGQQDKQIKITATFTPPGYPEEVKGEATINVKPLEYDATLTIKGSYRRRQSSSYKDPPGGTCTGNGTFSLQENIDASFYVPLKMEDAGDMPILNQRWEYYRPLDINLSSFNASIRTRTYAYLDCKGNGHRTTMTKNKNPVNRKVPEKDYLLKSNIILIIDKKTDKVVKIATGGFPVEFLWDETEKTTGVEWSKEEGTKPINRSTHKTDDLATMFTAGPVEDPVPDPTFTSVSESLKKYMKDLGTPLPADIDIPEDEEKPEIEPDLLVKFGDGKTYFGGEGKKIIDNSEGSTVGREEFNFFWQVTRKRKPL